MPVTKSSQQNLIARFNDFVAHRDDDSFCNLDRAIASFRFGYGTAALNIDEKCAILKSIKPFLDAKMFGERDFDEFSELFRTMSKRQEDLNVIKMQLSLLDIAQDKQANAIILDRAIDYFFPDRDGKMSLIEKCQFLKSVADSSSPAIAEYEKSMTEISAQKSLITKLALQLFVAETVETNRTELEEGYRITQGCLMKKDKHSSDLIRPFTNKDRAAILAQAVHLTLQDCKIPLSFDDRLEIAQSALDQYCVNPQIAKVIRRYPPPVEYEEDEVAFVYATKMAEFGISGITGHQIELQNVIDTAEKHKQLIDRVVIGSAFDCMKPIIDQEITINGRSFLCSQAAGKFLVKDPSGSFAIQVQLDSFLSKGSVMRVVLMEKDVDIKFNSDSLPDVIKDYSSKDGGSEVVDEVLKAIEVAQKAAHILSQSKGEESSKGGWAKRLSGGSRGGGGRNNKGSSFER